MKTKTEEKAAVGKGITGKSGVNKTTFFLTSLKENEKAKKNDVELQKIWDKEFPDGSGRRWLVSEIRHMLNRGHYKANALAGFESHEFGAPAKETPVKEKAAVPTEPEPTHPPTRRRK